MVTHTSSTYSQLYNACIRYADSLVPHFKLPFWLKFIMVITLTAAVVWYIVSTVFISEVQATSEIEHTYPAINSSLQQYFYTTGQYPDNLQDATSGQGIRSQIAGFTYIYKPLRLQIPVNGVNSDFSTWMAEGPVCDYDLQLVRNDPLFSLRGSSVRYDHSGIKSSHCGDPIVTQAAQVQENTLQTAADDASSDFESIRIAELSYYQINNRYSYDIAALGLDSDVITNQVPGVEYVYKPQSVDALLLNQAQYSDNTACRYSLSLTGPTYIPKSLQVDIC